jgi:hypothetical protein
MTARSHAYDRFMASTDIGYEEWHDGIGYDLEALAQLDGVERAEVERWLLARANEDWRDVEALDALRSATADAAVRETLRTGKVEQRLAAAGHVRDRVAGDGGASPETPRRSGSAVDPDVEAAIVAGLDAGDLMQGLTRALTLAEEHPTPRVLDALFRCALRGSSVARVHAAALVAYLHGNAREAFDCDRRPFWLEFGVEDPATFEAAFRRLCEECGVDPAPYLDPA